jgi:hypothetical protein
MIADCQLPIADCSTPRQRPLWLLRMIEERIHAELLHTTRDALEAASTISVHHSWLDEVWDFLLENRTNWWSYKIKHDTLVSRYADSGIYIQELEACRAVARSLRHYAAIQHRVCNEEIWVYGRLRQSAIGNRKS